MTRRLRLQRIDGEFAVCRLHSDDAIPEWTRGTFVSISRTPHELSIVCESRFVPEEAQAERGWGCVSVVGPIPFEVTGVAAKLCSPLADAGIPLFLVSTYDTDYLLVKEALLDRALRVLASAGWDVD